uniref:Huntingtin-interacting protein 1-related protein n=1 Tax=Amphiprion ocellaris TaxID=80972 RepID=A0AAQ5XDA9_AMPOC
MDRVKSSMQQVPNAIPKVIRRTGGASSLELEKENFERGQAVSINKAINTQEVAVKEKHARNILLLSMCKGAHTFWAAVNRLPLSSNAVLCWKFCHVFHKLLRDGHPNVIKDSMRNKADLTDMSRMWGHLSEGYGKLCSIYLKLLITKMEFHIKNPRFPGNLQMSNRQLDEAGENDVNNFFQLTVEMFDYLECELNLFLGVFSSLDMSRSVSVTAAGQCRLAPLIQVILDCSHLYDYTVKLLFKLHSCESHKHTATGETVQLQPQKQQPSLKYPAFFCNSANLVNSNLVAVNYKFAVCKPACFSYHFNSQSVTLQWSEFKVHHYNKKSGRLCQALRGRVSELEAELAEQSHLRLQAVGESEFLKAELDDLRRVREDTEKEQRSLTEIERKAQANEQRYTKLKEKYTELVQSHADLLRKNAEVTRQMTVARAAQDEVEAVRKEMQEKVKAAHEALLLPLQKLRPRGLELQQGELGDLVEQEMAATSAAVESAAARIEEMLNKSRAVDTGIKMEVNERILASCTELMQAIKELILSSKDLQRDIVESGRGAATMKEFYAKNSRWTEGLISASKAVGWGATVMVDAADLVVQGKGKFEELMVCSHEIAASTAQLVAASKVKADKDSSNLQRLQQASRGVTQATAAVVASTKSGKSQIEETDTMDFSSMTLTQIKRQEMDAQVLVLELETRLQKERERLGELRKKHYELAGVAEGWGEEEEGEHEEAQSHCNQYI